MCAYCGEEEEYFDSLEELETKVDIDTLDFSKVSVRETEDGKIKMTKRSYESCT